MISKTYQLTDDNGNEISCKGDEIIKMPDGSLLTVYHYIKNSAPEIEKELIETGMKIVEET